jgi:hypothetical protein
MKKALSLALALLVTAASFAASTKPIEDVFQRYWSAYSKKDFVKAAADVLPSDLDEAKKELLPIFLQAQSHQDKQIQEMVSAFFGRTVGKAREAMTPVDVFAGLNRVVTSGNPELFEVLKDAALTVVFVRTPDADNAEIHYQIMVRGQSDMDVDALTKKNGRWWVRINEDPKEVAANFKGMLEQKK